LSDAMRHLILLCHKRGALARDPLVPHAGQYGRAARRVRAVTRRWVVMEAGLCRSGRTGGASWAETVG
jgi:hypothetical protein